MALFQVLAGRADGLAVARSARAAAAVRKCFASAEMAELRCEASTATLEDIQLRIAGQEFEVQYAAGFEIGGSTVLTNGQAATELLQERVA